MKKNPNLKVLLSICIPTWNRYQFLDKCLNSIRKNILELDYDQSSIEILIFNNKSTDNTEKIINKYKRLIPQIKSTTNKYNIGADLNISNCYDKAIGEFIWTLGDDDQVIPGTFNYVLKMIKNNLINKNIGVIYVKSFSYNDIEISPPPSSKRIKIMSSDKILLKLNVKLTFISSLIIRSSKTKNSQIYASSNLVQFNLVVDLLNKYDNHVVIDRYSVLSKRDNSGEFVNQNIENYNRVNVFLLKFLKIVRRYKNKQKTYKIVKKKLLINYFLFVYAFTWKSSPKKEDLILFDRIYSKDFYYIYLIKFLLVNMDSRLVNKISLFILFLTRSVDGEFFKIVNYFLKNKLTRYFNIV